MTRSRELKALAFRMHAACAEPGADPQLIISRYLKELAAMREHWEAEHQRKFDHEVQALREKRAAEVGE